MESRTPVMAGCCLLAFLLNSIVSAQTGPGSLPTRYQAQYTRIYFDDIESLAPTLGAGFVLDTAGTLTSDPSEVISGSYSIKGSYVGSSSYTSYLHTDPAIIPLTPNHAYRVTFSYRILVTPNQGFLVSFYSLTGGAAGSFLPGFTITGASGDTGTATLTNTLGPYNDYRAQWNIIGTGAIAINEIRITDAATGTAIATEDCEESAPVVGPGLQLQNAAAVVTDPAVVISGKASVRLKNYGALTTNPSAWSLAPNTTYIVEFQYRILNVGSADYVLGLWLQPAGAAYSQSTNVNLSQPLKNAPVSGTFSSGALTAGAASYVLYIAASSDSDVVVDNIAIFRQDAVPSGSQPAAWSKLATKPYPRLGKYSLGTSFGQALAGGLAEGPPLRVSVDQVESRLAFADVILGAEIDMATWTPDEVRRLRQMNPDVVILPYRAAFEESVGSISVPTTSNTSLDYQFLQGIPDSWYLRDSKGNYVPEPTYPGNRLMNISPYCPVVNGQTYISYLLDWLNHVVFPSGVWDGVFFDDLFGRTNIQMVNNSNPALIDADYNRNGVRDETPAWISDMTRSAAIGMLQQFWNSNGDMQLVVGNAGPLPELGLASYVNGYVFECMTAGWNSSVWQPSSPATLSPAGWRTEFEAYRTMQTNTLPPRINVLEGCGGGGFATQAGQGYSAPTATDIQNHRFTMGTALLSDGFYWYDLHGNLSAPLWFDEFSVDSSGTAVEDRAKKGYLGQALSGASELTDSGALIWQEGFEGGTLPPSLSANPPSAVSITHAAGEVISGTGSLVISNPDHTQPASVTASTNPSAVPLAAGSTYLLVFDWKILQTLDAGFSVYVCCSGSQPLDSISVPGIVSGDSGTMRFPFTIPAAGNWTIWFGIWGGGGKVAIDNIQLYRGGVGSWRRDFENGFVLVNPFLQPRTFTAADLAGALKRTGIRRIKGTQAPDVNNGQAVTGDLTLGAFDAIILLADHIAAPSTTKPYIVPNGVISAGAFGAFPTIAPGSWIEIYGSNLSATTRAWSGADFSGSSAPTSLDGVSVTVGGRPAYVAYVSPGQVNALVPSDAPLGQVGVVVSGPAGVSDAYIVLVEALRPGLLAPPSFQVSGKQYAAALFPDGQTFVLPSGAIPGVPSRPAKPGETIILYGIGFGPVTPNLAAGTLVGQLNSLSNPFQMFFGSTAATLAYYGLAPNLTGLYQFNVVVPNVADNAAVPLTFSLAGQAGTQTLYIAVQR